jgi:hypothetical protein
LGDPDTIKEDLRQAREINTIQVSARNCVSCLRKISVPGSVFDTQNFLKKYTGENFKVYYDIVKWSVNEKKKSLQYSNEDCTAMKYRAKIIGTHLYNRCEVYDR